MLEWKDKYGFFILSGILLLISSIVYLSQWENYPYAGDEYYVIFKFLIQFKTNPSVSLFFDSYNEHINVTTRSIALIQYLIFGQFSFYSFYLVGYLSFIGFSWMMIREYYSECADNSILAIGLFSFFFLTYHSVMSFSLVSIQYFTTSLFVLISFRLALKSSKLYSILLSVLFSLLATFTFGNGAFSFFIIGVILFKQKRFKLSILYFVIFGVVLYAYLHLFSLSQPKTHLYGNLYVMIRYFFHLTGLLWLENYIYETTFVGGVFILIYIFNGFQFLKVKDFKYPIVHAIFFYFLLTIVSITLSRHAKGVLDVFKLGYSFYTVMSMSTGLFLLMNNYEFNSVYKKVIFGTVIALYINSFGYNYSNFYTWKKVGLEQNTKFKKIGRGLWPAEFWNEKRDKEVCDIMRNLKKEGIYELP